MDITQWNCNRLKKMKILKRYKLKRGSPPKAHHKWVPMMDAAPQWLPLLGRLLRGVCTTRRSTHCRKIKRRATTSSRWSFQTVMRGVLGKSLRRRRRPPRTRRTSASMETCWCSAMGGGWSANGTVRTVRTGSFTRGVCRCFWLTRTGWHRPRRSCARENIIIDTTYSIGLHWTSQHTKNTKTCFTFHGSWAFSFFENTSISYLQ